MQTVDPLERLMLEKGIREKNFPTWKQSFTTDMRYEQLHDDHTAWRAVTGVLLFIIGVGLSLAVITVLLCG
ncbi:MAG: hypothetical protein AB7O38_07880 [Pirellulaceae bacterium]